MTTAEHLRLLVAAAENHGESSESLAELRALAPSLAVALAEAVEALDVIARGAWPKDVQASVSASNAARDALARVAGMLEGTE